jgi:hypothetical protein
LDAADEIEPELSGEGEVSPDHEGSENHKTKSLDRK